MRGSNRGTSAPVYQSGQNTSVSKSPPRRVERVERQSNFKVVVRVRPPLHRELSGELPFQNIIAVDEREQAITISENVDSVVDETGQATNSGTYSSHSYVFDHVYEQNASQKKVYEMTARAVVDSALSGYNATIFAYGQTGTGKTYTMEGFSEGATMTQSQGVEARGIIPRAIEQIFEHIQRHASPRMRFLVRASYLQIYNEQISDLLKPERSNLSIREDKKRGVFVDGLSEWVVRSPAEIYGLMQRGGAVRATGETKMNEVSSRSHAVFIVIAEQSETVYVDDNGQEMSPEAFQKFMHGRGVRREQEMNKLEDHVRQSFKVGKLNLVDLAGSERVRLSGATGQRLEESKQINRSLAALGNVISALTDTKGRTHVPYRDSKLTRMLEDSLGGNCRTTMMAMVSPALEAMVETLSTLKFANRAKNIKNEARVNEDIDQKSLLRKYERELKKLRAELEERSKNVVDKRRLLELDEQRRRAEADKMVAIKALEARSLEFMHEKEEKKRLEQRINMLMGQMLKGEKNLSGAAEVAGLSAAMSNGANGAFGQVSDEAMKEQQDRLREEYDGKLAEIERERETIEEEKAQVDRYKQLLLKQRDIMIALTQRLVERDEQIMALQDELDAYDRHHKELEEKLDEKTALLIKFQRISLEVNASSPFKSEELSTALEAMNRLDRGESASDEKPVEHASGAELVDPSSGVMRSLGSSTDSLQAVVANGGNSPDTKEASLVAAQRREIDALTLQVRSLQQEAATNSTGPASGGHVAPAPASTAGEKEAALRQVESALQVELEVHLSRLEQEQPDVRMSLRQPLSALMRTVLARVRTTGGTNADGGSTGASGAAGMDSAQERLLTDVQRLGSEKRTYEARLETMEKERGGMEQDLNNTRVRCDHLVKEREAVHTIMEQKIKVLVQAIAQSTSAVLPHVNGGSVYNPDSRSTSAQASQALTKDVAALQRLVNASIAALRNAASAQTQAQQEQDRPQLRGAPPPVPPGY